LDPRVHLFGIRHHGPGSAASLVKALDALDPALVLIEGAPESDALIPHAALPGMQPPVAILLYAADDPSLAIFEPFAEFSPEWQAMLWAARKARPARFIDLPAGAHLAAMAERKKALDAAAEGETSEGASALEEAVRPAEDPPLPEETGDEAGADKPSPEPPSDPFDLFAELAGHPNGEAWWNALVESRGASIEAFAAIEAAVTALRAELPARFADAPERQLREERREAHMRQEIRKALKQTEGTIAVVCGAWHVPALRSGPTANEDKALLKDLPSIKVETTWVPWTDSRLATQSGYGAGVLSLGWYRHLWSTYGADGIASAESFAAGWQALVAQTLRKAGYAGYTASAIEAARLAISLAALRNHAMPGLDEMRDATLAALCHGDETSYRVIESKLFIGERIGSIDEAVPLMPLAADLARWQKKTRLKPEALEQDVSLDLRSEAGLLKSTLLHRLLMIDVDWGRLIDAGSSRGTFRENWVLAWRPELSVKLAEAVVYGVTIEQAAGGRAVAVASTPQPIGTLAGIVRQCLLADLPQAAESCITALQAAAVHAADIGALMQAVPPLVSVLRYGTARPYPEAALKALVDALCAEANAGLHTAAQNLSEEAAAELHRALSAYDAALTLRGDEPILASFARELERVTHSESAAPLIAGFALRRLHDRGIIAQETAAARFSLRLSPILPPRAAADFLEGFLDGSADILIHDRTLLGLVDDWLTGLEDDTFTEQLPMLRRSFASFDAMGRRRLFQSLDAPVRARVREEAALSPVFAEALPLLHHILGIAPGEAL
jgi:hypothetical protein